MKNIVRLFVAALVLTGTAATFHTTAASAQTTVAPKVSAMPMPMCDPNSGKCSLNDL